ncbi:MAG: hypothetical protein WBW57_11220 [Candidatus Sulfotelmatobacter sp.]
MRPFSGTIHLRGTYYTFMVEWSRVLGGVPIYLHVNPELGSDRGV